MRTLYLILAALGAIVPFMFFLPFFMESGVSLVAFSRALFANGAAGGFSADLIISSLVFWIFMFAQRTRHRAPHPALFMVINLTIGLSCALPAYLAAREGKATEKV